MFSRRISYPGFELVWCYFSLNSIQLDSPWFRFESCLSPPKIVWKNTIANNSWDVCQFSWNCWKKWYLRGQNQIDPWNYCWGHTEQISFHCSTKKIWQVLVVFHHWRTLPRGSTPLQWTVHPKPMEFRRRKTTCDSFGYVFDWRRPKIHFTFVVFGFERDCKQLRIDHSCKYLVNACVQSVGIFGHSLACKV